MRFGEREKEGRKVLSRKGKERKEKRGREEGKERSRKGEWRVGRKKKYPEKSCHLILSENVQVEVEGHRIIWFLLRTLS